jgi:metal-responsive CopG/Arc/MetJ family transcriptional regulator
VLKEKDEMALVDRFCKQHRIQNRSKFFREAILQHILLKMEEDYPKLF